MTRLICVLLTLFFLNGPAMGENSDFGRSSLAAKTTLSTVDDFAVQAQTRLNAVKAEFGNVEAFNMVTPKPVSLSRLNPPTTRPFADPGKLARHGEFDWNKYTPIIVEERNGILTIQDGMTRFENARRAGITELPAYVFPSR